MKVRMQFEKNISYISHLELMRAIQKILKRSELPLKYSEGFNPHIVLSVAVPIPVGVAGKSEYADFELTKEMPENIILEELQKASDEGIKPVAVLSDYTKDFKYAKYAQYEIDIETEEADKIIEFLSRSEIPAEKKAKGKIKIIDLKEYIHKTEFEKKEGGIKIKALFACGIEKNLNPMLIRKTMMKEDIKFSVFSAVRLGIFDEDMRGFME